MGLFDPAIFDPAIFDTGEEFDPVVQEDLIIVYRGEVPRDIGGIDADLDTAYAMAAIFAAVEGDAAFLGRQMFLSTATGIYVDLHLRDVGLSRQNGETDDQAKDRARRPPQAGTVPAIRAALEQIVGEGNVVIVELPRDGCFYDRRMCYDRGSRMGGGRGVVIALVPTAALESVKEALRVKASAGKITLAEGY